MRRRCLGSSLRNRETKSAHPFLETGTEETTVAGPFDNLKTTEVNYPAILNPPAPTHNVKNVTPP